MVLTQNGKVRGRRASRRAPTPINVLRHRLKAAAVNLLRVLLCLHTKGGISVLEKIKCPPTHPWHRQKVWVGDHYPKTAGVADLRQCYTHRMEKCEVDAHRGEHRRL